MRRSTQSLFSDLEQIGETSRSSLRVDSHVSRTAWPENDWEKRTNAIYGRKCLESFEKFPRIGLWAKTFSELLIGTMEWSSMRCRLIWRLRGTKYNRIYFQLVPSTPRTEGIEPGLSHTNGLLKTPTVFDGKVSSGKAHPVSGNSGSLAQEIMSEYPPTMMKLGLIPTPTVFDSTGASANMKSSQVKDGSMHSMTLARYVMLPTPTAIQRDHPERVKALHEKGAKTMRSRVNGEARPNSILDALMFERMLPTPTCNDMKNASLPPSQGNRADSIVKRIVSENPQAGESQQLNPAFVGEMMGFPEGWTLKPYINGDREIGEPTDFSNFPQFNPTISKDEIQDMDGITASKWRNESIKAYGNAIVPEVAYNIFQAINKYENR